MEQQNELKRGEIQVRDIEANLVSYQIKKVEEALSKITSIVGSYDENDRKLKQLVVNQKLDNNRIIEQLKMIPERGDKK